MSPAVPDIRAHRHGFDDPASANEARDAAIQHGIAVMGIHGATWPAKDEYFCKMICNRLIDELMKFSIYARRFMEIADVRDVAITGSLYGLKAGTSRYQFETDLWNALNLILHSRYLNSVMFDYAEADKFVNLGERYIPFIEARSDRRPDEIKYICPTAVVVTLYSTDRHFPNSRLGA